MLETTDEAELRAYLCALREAGIDGAMVRIDTLCGRLTCPTTHQVSRFAPHPTGEVGDGQPGR